MRCDCDSWGLSLFSVRTFNIEVLRREVRETRKATEMSLEIPSLTHAWSFVGIFAAFHTVATIIPFSIAVGGNGFISVGLLSASLIGLLLGPIYGPIAVLIGSYVGIVLNPPAGVLGPYTPIATAAGALAAGCLRTGKGQVVGIVYPIAVVAYVASPIAPYAPLYLWLHLIALPIALVMLIPGVASVVERGLDTSSPTQLTLFLGITSFLSVMTDHIVGSAIAAYYFVSLGVSPESVATSYNIVLLVYPVERIVATILIVVVGLALFKALSGTPFLRSGGQS